MIHISTTQAQATLRQMASRLSEQQIAKATMRAINHTLSKGKTAASSAILTRYNMPSKGIKSNLPIYKATTRRIEGKVNAKTKPIPLIDFKGTRQTNKGASVAILKGQRKLIRHAFIQTTKSGRKGVFGRGQHKGGQFEWRHKRIVKRGPDMPIEELSTVSLYTAGESQPVQATVGRIVNASYTTRLIHEMNRISNGNP